MSQRAMMLVALAACGSTESSPPTKHGGIWINSDSYHAQSVAHGEGAAGAAFADGGGLCTKQASFGSCDVSSCTDIEMPFTSYSAGTVTIADAAVPITLTAGMHNVYLDHQTTYALYAYGATLKASATGADVAAFATSFTTPTKATITSPTAPPEQTPITMTKAAGFTFAWTGFSTGTVHAAVTGGVNSSVQVDCSFDASAGTGTIPPEALGMVPTADWIQFHIESITEQEVDAGDWAVTLRATSQAVWPSDVLAGGMVTLE